MIMADIDAGAPSYTVDQLFNTYDIYWIVVHKIKRSKITNGNAI